MHKHKEFDCVEVGVFSPEMQKTDCLQAGDVGYVCASIAAAAQAAIGNAVYSNIAG